MTVLKMTDQIADAAVGMPGGISHLNIQATHLHMNAIRH